MKLVLFLAQMFQINWRLIKLDIGFQFLETQARSLYFGRAGMQKESLEIQGKLIDY